MQHMQSNICSHLTRLLNFQCIEDFLTIKVPVINGWQTGVRTGQLRTGQYQGQSRSNAIGDILFISKDYQDFSFNNIQDPKGLADMIKAAKQMLEEEKKKEEDRE